MNRTAYEIAEHIVAHVYDLDVIANNAQCDERLKHDFDNPKQLSDEMKRLWEKALDSLNEMSNEQWENEPIELLIEGKSFITLPRMHMMWFFHNDIIHTEVNYLHTFDRWEVQTQPYTVIVLILYKI